eukprot:193484_1
MTQCFVDASSSFDGEVEGSNDEDKQQMSLWLKHHGLNDDVLSVLNQNCINSLNDLMLLETEEDINLFVNTSGIKLFMVKKKLINAIKQFQNETKTTNDNCDNDEKEVPNVIRWGTLESNREKKETIKMQSNKSGNIQIPKTTQKPKQRLSEWINQYAWSDDSYWSALGKAINCEYEEDGIGGASEVGLLAMIFTIIPVFPAAYAIGKRIQSKKNENLTHKKHYNAQSRAFNDKLAQIKHSEKYILSKQNELKQQERKLNSHCFELERICDIHNKSRVVMLIGPTGFGKSLIANRLLGNEHDIDHIMESNECDFNVGQSGNAESVTKELNKKSKIVHMTTEENKDDSFVLSVVDTPGAFDSNDNDDDYNNVMSHYLDACGGINVFVIFFRFNGKMTNKYKELLKQYATFFGDGLWKHCAVFITYCDKYIQKRVTKGLKTTKDQVHSFLKEISNGQCDG